MDTIYDACVINAMIACVINAMIRCLAQQNTFINVSSLPPSFHAVVIPAYSSPYECPSPKLLTKNCSTCAEGELCCNSVCTKAVLPARPCDVVVASNYPSRLGAYVPQCSADGKFNPVQIWGSTGSSWCVDTSNGKAVSEAVPRGQQPNCISMLTK